MDTKPTILTPGIRIVGLVIAKTSSVLLVILTMTCIEFRAMSVVELERISKALKSTVISRSG